MPTPAVVALQRETLEIPIVFAALADPIGSGFIASLSRRGGNITGVMQYEPSVTGKWLSMFKDIAPRFARVGFVINPKTAPFYNYYLRAAEPLSQSLGIELETVFFETPTEINRAIELFARVPNGALLVPPDITTFVHRDLIIALAARHSLPAVYSFRLLSWPVVSCPTYRSCRYVSAGGIGCRPYPARRQAGRPPGASGEQV